MKEKKQSQTKKKKLSHTSAKTSRNQKLCSRNHVEGINILVVSIVKYSEPFLKKTREELRQMEQRT